MASSHCPFTRRDLILGAGCAGLAVLLVGCGGTEPDAPSVARPATGAATPAAATGPAEPALPADALVRTADVPLGGGVLVDGPVLVVQPSAGVYKAYDGNCSHQAFTVGLPDAQGVITCPGHLAHYRASDGSLIDGPAPRGLTPIPVKADGEYVRRV